jgi:hypothetical protein
MVTYSFVFSVSGSEFSPDSVERSTGISFTTKHEPGVLGAIGRYRGMPMPYGSAELAAPEEYVDPEAIDQRFLLAVGELVPACEVAGATTIVLHINAAYRDQCNIEVSSAFLASLARLGVTVTMTCFEDDS